MYRQEFLETMEDQLSGKMAEGRVAAHLRYYEDYIQSKVRAGESEEEVISALGDPRLIARSLLDAEARQDSYGEDTSDHYRSYSYENSEDISPEGSSGPVSGLSTTAGKVITVIAGLLILYLVARLFIIGLPFFLILALVLFFIHWIRERR